MPNVVSVILMIATIEASAEGGNQCVYKDVMTNAEMEACRHASPPTDDTAAIRRRNVELTQQLTEKMDAAKAEKAAAEAERAKQPKEPQIGMAAEQVRATTGLCWGKPSKINKTVSLNGEREQWVFECGSLTRYVYFVNGIVTTIQK